MGRTELALVTLSLLVSACGRTASPLPPLPEVAPTPAPRLELPRDAGPHDALTEWWYFTGHLTAADGHAYGFEFTIFQARRQGAPAGYLAHFAVSDVDGQRFSHQAHLRQVAAEAPMAFPLDVDGWTLASDPAGDAFSAAMSPGPGADPPFTLQLRLADDKPPALHHGGYIDYGPAGGSYYYSRTRLSAVGTLAAADGAAQAVSGVAWMDHQWGNFVVTAAGGWDWYSLQLDDRSELMLYVLRAPTGETTGVYGTRVAPDGSVEDLAPGAVSASATDTWQSPHTGAVYPSGWRIALNDGEQLVLQPLLADQELYFPEPGGQAAGAGAMAYWEGAVSVGGDRSGVGYVELTGYAGLSGTGR